MQHDRNPVSNLHPSAKVDTVNLVDFQCNANWRVYTQNHGSEEALQKHIHHHVTSIIKYHQVIPRFPGVNDHWKAHRHLVKPSRTLHRAGSHNTTITRATWATSWQKPVLTQDDPC